MKHFCFVSLFFSLILFSSCSTSSNKTITAHKGNSKNISLSKEPGTMVSNGIVYLNYSSKPAAFLKASEIESFHVGSKAYTGEPLILFSMRSGETHEISFAEMDQDQYKHFLKFCDAIVQAM